MNARILGGIVTLAWASCLPSAALCAATPLQELRLSTDVTVPLDATLVNDEDVGVDHLAGTTTLESIGVIPSEADLDAYAVKPNGDELLSFDTTVSLPGGLIAQPADVVRYNGSSYALEFNGALSGVPAGVNVDAVGLNGDALLLSFDVGFDVAPSIGGVHIDKEDLVSFDAPSATFTMFFDGSAAGVPPGLDLDAADVLECNGHLLLSFDGSGEIGGVSFDDEDVLEFDRATTWVMAYDGSAHHASLGEADVDAIHAVVNLGPGPPVVFNQTIQADPDKQTIRWPTSVTFKLVRGSFVSSPGIGAYTVGLSQSGTGSSASDAATPSPGLGFWYLVKPLKCSQTSWQSTLGLEPGRDAAIP